MKELHHKTDVNIDDVLFPISYWERDEDGFIITDEQGQGEKIEITDMNEMHIDIMIKRLVKDGFGSKDYVEQNYGITDFFRNALINKFDNYCERITTERMQKGMKKHED